MAVYAMGVYGSIQLKLPRSDDFIVWLKTQVTLSNLHGFKEWSRNLQNAFQNSPTFLKLIKIWLRYANLKICLNFTFIALLEEWTRFLIVIQWDRLKILMRFRDVVKTRLDSSIYHLGAFVLQFVYICPTQLWGSCRRADQKLFPVYSSAHGLFTWSWNNNLTEPRQNILQLWALGTQHLSAVILILLELKSRSISSLGRVRRATLDSPVATLQLKSSTRSM